MALAIFVFLVQNAVFIFEINNPVYQTNAVYYAQIIFFLNNNIKIPKRSNHLKKQTKECDPAVRDSIAFFCQWPGPGLGVVHILDFDHADDCNGKGWSKSNTRGYQLTPPVWKRKIVPWFRRSWEEITNLYIIPGWVHQQDFGLLTNTHLEHQQALPLIWRHRPKKKWLKHTLPCHHLHHCIDYASHWQLTFCETLFYTTES